MKRFVSITLIFALFCFVLTGCGTQVDIPRLTSPQASNKVLSCPLPEDCEIRDITDQFDLDNRFAVYGIYSDTGVRCAYVTLYSNDNSTLVMATIKVMLSCDKQYSQKGMEWANNLLDILYPNLQGKLFDKLTEENPWDLSSLKAISLGGTYSNTLSSDNQRVVYDILGGHYASIQLWYMEE